MEKWIELYFLNTKSIEIIDPHLLILEGQIKEQWNH